MNSFISNARLRQWLSRPNIPPAIKTCALLFSRLFGATLSYTRGEEEELDLDLECDEADERSVRASGYSIPCCAVS